MASQSITIRGLTEVSQAFKQMDRKTAIKVIRKSFRRALTPLKSRYAELAPKKTGALASSAKILSGGVRRGLIRVRLVIGKGAYRGDTFYGSFQELGWKVGSRKLGDKRKKVIAKHFLRQTYEEGGQQASDVAE